jgi:hypothetical protein
VKIINNTGTRLNYFITTSGQGSPVISSGVVDGQSATDDSVPTAGSHPMVYVKPDEQNGNKGFARRVANGNSTVAITFEEI